jgi:DNA-binding NarL/FixJ family response regulator
VGYLLKDRIGDVVDFVDSVRRVAAGGTVMDPQVIAKLLARPAHPEPLTTLTPREREVLSLMAQGRSNASIASRMTVTERTVNKHINAIFAKLGLTQSETEHRRVQAVLTYLGA